MSLKSVNFSSGRKKFSTMNELTTKYRKSKTAIYKKAGKGKCNHDLRYRIL